MLALAVVTLLEKRQKQTEFRGFFMTITIEDSAAPGGGFKWKFNIKRLINVRQ